MGPICPPSSQTCVPKKFRWCRWGAERRVKRAQTWERGPPSAPAEICYMSIYYVSWAHNIYIYLLLSKVVTFHLIVAKYIIENLTRLRLTHIFDNLEHFSYCNLGTVTLLIFCTTFFTQLTLTNIKHTNEILFIVFNIISFAYISYLFASISTSKSTRH